MRRLLGCLTIAAFALTFGVTTAQDKKKDDKKNPTTKEIMKKVPGKEGLVAQIKTAAEGGKWEDAQKIGKQLKEYGEALGKNKQKKGEKDSWETQTKTFSETMTALADAADKKDKTALTDAAKKFGGSCKACHDAHK